MKTILILIFSLSSYSTWALNVLQIGDSHTVQGFGEGIFKAFQKNSHVSQVRSIGLAGASASHYAATQASGRTLNVAYIDRPRMQKSVTTGTVDQLSTLINSQKPDMLVIELGDNFGSYAAETPNKIQAYAQKNNVSIETAKSQIHQKINLIVEQQADMILNQIANSPKKPSECFWVGPNWTDHENVPPYYKTNARAQEVTDLIAQKIEGYCTMIDSMKIVKKSEVETVDNLHLTKNLGLNWGQKAYDSILQKSKLFQ